MKNIPAARVILLVSICFALVSCGEKPGETSAWTDATITTAKPVETSTATAVDPDAKSNSKGIGKFTSLNIDDPGPLDAGKGRTLFAARCAACHQLNAVKVIGPGLAHITDRRTQEWILNQITNPMEMSAKDPVGQALLSRYVVQMTDQNISDKQATQILAFLSENDLKK